MKRSSYLDVVKGLAIIMVVFTHSIQWGSGSSFYNECLYFDDQLFKFVYGFHMPLFMIVSGYLFWGTICRHKPMEVAMSRLRALLLPIVTCQTIYLIILSVLGMTVLSMGWLYSYGSALWFLRSVLGCSFMLLVGHVLLKDSLLFHVVVWALLLLIPAERLSGLHVFMYPYFVFGYYWNKLNGKERYRSFSGLKKISVLMASFGLYMVLLCGTFDSPERSVYIMGMSLQGRSSVWIQLIIDLLRYIYGGLGIIMTMITVDLCFAGRQFSSDRNLQHWIVLLGRNTLGIYIFNFFTTQLLLLLPFNGHYFYMASIAETIVMLIGAMAVIWLVRRTFITRLLFLGEK